MWLLSSGTEAAATFCCHSFWLQISPGRDVTDQITLAVKLIMYFWLLFLPAIVNSSCLLNHFLIIWYFLRTMRCIPCPLIPGIFPIIYSGPPTEILPWNSCCHREACCCLSKITPATDPWKGTRATLLFDPRFLSQGEISMTGLCFQE